MQNEKLVYLISPVRQVTPEQAEIIAAHAASLKKDGVRLFNPIEDAPQEDRSGFNIVMAELNFMREVSEEDGQIDILWNAGGTPSEGSRVDLGIAFALGIEFNLVRVFNEESPTGPQIGLEIIKELQGEKPLDILWNIYGELSKIKSEREVTIDWNIEMTGVEQEWQRIRLGLALGWLIQNPDLKIKMGDLVGIDPEDKKSYPKVIREIERRQARLR